MNALLIVAHPVPDSLNRHLADLAQNAAGTAGLSLRRIDLYESGFEPRLSAGERSAYYAHADAIPDDSIAGHATALQNAELLILVFPTWWYGFPAILKGWFDRVWRPGIAFEHAPDKSRLRPRLDRLQQVVAITTMGSPRWIDLLVMRQPLRRVLRLAILHPCAPKARLHWLALHNAETVSPARVAAFGTRIRRAIARAAR